MDDLIEALKIFRKYTDAYNPTNCTHDEFLVNVDPDKVSEEDKIRLGELSFTPDRGSFSSYRFGAW